MPNLMPQRITVIFDEQCELCRRCHEWLEQQPTYLPVGFLAAGSEEARRVYGGLPWLGADLVVVAESGDVWVGSDAFLVCLWATRAYRPWSYRLHGRALAPLANRFFHTVSSNRRSIGRFVGSRDCPDGRCRHRPTGTTQESGVAARLGPPILNDIGSDGQPCEYRPYRSTPATAQPADEGGLRT